LLSSLDAGFGKKDGERVFTAPSYVKNLLKGPAGLTLAVFVLDQLTKFLVRYAYDLGHRQELIPHIFDLVYIRNTGAAWGIASGNSEMLAVLSVVIVLFIVWKFDYLTEGVRIRRLALGAVLGGILGNLVDRILLPGVVDFLDLHYGEVFSWPAFNIADCGISIGVGVFIVSVLFAGDSETAGKEGITDTEDDGKV